MGLSVSPLAHSNGIKVMECSLHLLLIKGLHRYSELFLLVELDVHAGYLHYFVGTLCSEERL